MKISDFTDEPERPERIYHVSQTQFSVARYYGKCKINGADYHYDDYSDTLTRMDIWKTAGATDKKGAEKVAKAERAKWEKAQDSFVEF